MVCYLKQFEYLLLRRWPKEHQHLADLMALDRIPCLIRLFRSLVHAIEATVEPQGYGKMAEAVLAWLSNEDEANLKVINHKMTNRTVIQDVLLKLSPEGFAFLFVL